MKNIVISITLLLLFTFTLQAQKHKTDANIVGHAICEGEHLSFVSIAVKGTVIGTVTDETGHFRITNLPPGKNTIVASCVGYKSAEKTINISINTTTEINFELETDVLGLDEVIVSSDRNNKKRGKAPVVVSTISHQILAQNQSVTISDGLNFMTGLRMESNCQNCGFTQLRMNGLEGPYSQILINNRPVFSGLAGVYGLELIPANIIERIEVVRGGGSALYGGNAIAGTVNLILKEPVKNYFQAGTSFGLAGVGFSNNAAPASDNNINFSASVITDDSKTGLTLFGFNRKRNPFDANNDEFSELALIDNTSLGARIHHRFGTKSKISADFLNIKEKRRGGSDLDKPSHEARISEAVEHSITNATISFNRFFREQDQLSVYISGQTVSRDSYYGAHYSLSDYGFTSGLTYNAGLQYSAIFDDFSMVVGAENIGDKLKDEKLGYADYENAYLMNDNLMVPHTENTLIVDQLMNSYGIFSQLDYDFKTISLSAGLRYEFYSIRGNFSDEELGTSGRKGNVVSPRFSVLWNIQPFLKYRISYAQGYRAPQIFDEDLHIVTSGSRKVIHVNSEDLTQETSRSYTTSLDYNTTLGSTRIQFLVEGFYTHLLNPFANQASPPNADGVITFLRINSKEGALVKGMNFETDIIPSKNISINAGFTWQSSMYEAPQDFNEKHFLRTPDTYGFITANSTWNKGIGLSLTGNYTGKMLVPHYGININTASDEMLIALANGDIVSGDRLETSSTFLDLSAKFSYTFRINGAKMQILGGVKNIFNAFQANFDSGIYRDPGYTYGPIQPRTIYIGFNIGNRLLN